MAMKRATTGSRGIGKERPAHARGAASAASAGVPPGASTGSATAPAVRRTIRVQGWPVWSHLCAAGGVRTVKLGRNGRVVCPGCGTEAIYTKPQARRRDSLPQGGRTHF
jgi:predicted RNA-binding Zn-ribbon protein involved in translation (DUF1610 family)